MRPTYNLPFPLADKQDIKSYLAWPVSPMCPVLTGLACGSGQDR